MFLLVSRIICRYIFISVAVLLHNDDCKIVFCYLIPDALHFNIIVVKIYRQISNMRRTLKGNTFLTTQMQLERRRCFNYIFIPDLTPSFNRLRKDNCKTRREPSKFCELVRFILDILRIMFLMGITAIYSSCSKLHRCFLCCILICFRTLVMWKCLTLYVLYIL